MPSGYRSAIPIDDAQPLVQLCHKMLGDHWRGQGVHQVQVTATDPRQAIAQPDLFSNTNPRRAALNKAMDKINDKYGEFTSAPARLLSRSEMPNVIAPGWRPFGHRQTIQDQKK